MLININWLVNLVAAAMDGRWTLAATLVLRTLRCDSEVLRRIDSRSQGSLVARLVFSISWLDHGNCGACFRVSGDSRVMTLVLSC